VKQNKEITFSLKKKVEKNKHFAKKENGEWNFLMESLELGMLKKLNEKIGKHKLDRRGKKTTFHPGRQTNLRRGTRAG